MFGFSVILFAVAAGCNSQLQLAATALQHHDVTRAEGILKSAGPACGSRSSRFYELKGVASSLSGNLGAAEDAFRTASSLDPKSPNLLADLGAAYLRDKKPARAAKVLREALTRDPSDRIAQQYLIGSYVQLHEWQDAFRLFHQLGVDRTPELLDNPVVFLWFVQTLIGTNQTERMDALLKHREQGMSPALLFSLAGVFAEHRMYRMAANYLAKIPTPNADQAVYFDLGLAYSHLREFDQARRCYFEAIDKQPGYVDAYFRVGLDYAANGNARKALPWLFRASALDPNQPDISYALVEQLVQLKYFATAQQELSKAVARAPEDPLLETASGDLKQAQGDSSGAVRIYHKLLAKKARFVPALVSLARALTSQGKNDEALGELRKAISVEPNDSSANSQLGLLEAKQHDWVAASTHLEKAWSEDHSHRTVALALARTLLHTKRPHAALQILESLAPALHSSRAFHVQLAQIYRQLGRTAQARAEDKQVTELEAQAQDVLHFNSPKTYIH
ncbi:MAG TPA: tetratricopeptide repeat protein [Bryobacteraceae bacterium]